METIKLNLNEMSEIRIINALISSERFTTVETIYKNTKRLFLKKYGFTSDIVPTFFVANDMFYKLTYVSFKSHITGKIVERLYYAPVCRAFGKFTKYSL